MLGASVQSFFGSLERCLTPACNATSLLKSAYGEAHDGTLERLALQERIEAIALQMVRPAPARLPSLMEAAMRLEADMEQRLARCRQTPRGCALPNAPARVGVITKSTQAQPMSECAEDEQGVEEVECARTPPTPELRGRLSMLPLVSTSAMPAGGGTVPADAKQLLSALQASPGLNFSPIAPVATQLPTARRVLLLTDPPLTTTFTTALPQPVLTSPPPTLPPFTNSARSAPVPAPSTLITFSTASVSASPSAPPTIFIASAPRVVPIPTSGKGLTPPVNEGELNSLPAYLRAQVALSQLNELRQVLCKRMASDGCVREADAVQLLGGGARAKAVLLLLIKLTRLRSVVQNTETMFLST